VRTRLKSLGGDRFQNRVRLVTSRKVTHGSTVQVLGKWPVRAIRALSSGIPFPKPTGISSR
jgi:hypothetical protein